MKKHYQFIFFMSMLLSFMFLPQQSSLAHAHSDAVIRIGVLAKRSSERCCAQWGPTAVYLTEQVSGYRFKIVPLGFDEVIPAVEQQEVDFVLCDPALYVSLEMTYHARRLVTLKRAHSTGIHSTFGGVVFCRSDRSDINSFTDLARKHFMAVDETSFGGWQMAWRELKDQGLHPYHDFASLRFGGTHDAVVYAVHDGDVDAGTVRTETLERMALEQKINLDDFKVLEHHLITSTPDDVSFLHSTRLYPEWPFSQLPHIEDKLADHVAGLLLEINPDMPAAQAAHCAGWTIPLNYQAVHDCLRELRIGPYKNYGNVMFRDVMRRYSWWVITILILAGCLVLTVILMIVLNRRIQRAKDYDELLFNVIPSGIFTVDTQCRITSWNKKAAEITGYSADEVTGKKCTLFAETPCRDDCGMFSQDTPKPIVGRECTIVCKDGTRRIIAKNGDYIRDEKGMVIGGIESFDDISRRKEMKKALEDAKQRLEEKVVERTKALQEKLNELERFRTATIDREFRMEALRKELNDLRNKSGDTHE